MSARLRWSLVVALGLVLAAVGGLFLRPSPPRVGSSDPKAVRAYLDGADALRRYRYPEALEALQLAVTRDPSFAAAHLELGIAQARVGRRDRAWASILRADSLAAVVPATTSLERLRIAHQAALMEQDHGRAAHCFDELLREHPEAAYTLRVRARRALEDDDPARARSLYRELLALHPDRVDVHNDLGYLALEAEEYEEAVASFQRYAFYASDSANPHDSLGEAYLWTGRYHESSREYLRALEIDPGLHPSAIGACDAFASTGQFRRALEILDTTEELFLERGEHPTWEIKRLQVLNAAERWAEVALVCERLLGDETFGTRSHPGHELWVRALQTLALARTGATSEARDRHRELEDFVENLLAKIPSTDEDAREEIELLRSAVAVRFAVATDTGVLEALADLRGRIETSPRAAHRLIGLRAILVEGLVDAGLHDDAIEVAEEVFACNPRHPDTSFHAARARLHRREREQAVAHLRTYLDVMRLADPGIGEVAEARRIIEKLVPSS